VALQSSGSKNQENKGSKPDIGKYSRYPISKKNHKKRLAEWLKKRKRAKCVCSQMFVSNKKKKKKDYQKTRVWSQALGFMLIIPALKS
jgi:hypothetical protein